MSYSISRLASDSFFPLIFIFNGIYAHVSECRYMSVSAGTFEGQKRDWNPWRWSYR